jgi:zinc protease
MILLKYFHFLFLLFFIFISAFIFSQELKADLTRKELKELTLQNGMRVCIKQSHKEPGEFAFQLFAIGGYGSLPAADRPSAFLAAETAWESGLGKQTGDELACALDDHAIDMEIEIGLFDRSIEAQGSISELGYSLSLARLLFTEPKFKEDAFKKVLKINRDKLQKKADNGKFPKREIFLKVNLRNWNVPSPMTLLDLDKVQLEKMAHLFKNFFSNPGEFILVLAGDFDPQVITPLIEKSLGTLPRQSSPCWNQPDPPLFPEGITKKEFSGTGCYKTSLTRLTFPLSTQAIKFSTLDLLCSLLKNHFPSNLGNSCGMTISYEFPLFPILDPAWLVIQFSSPPSEICSTNQTILQTLTTIKKQGFTEKEVQDAYHELINQQANSDDLLSEILLLSNCYIMKGNASMLYSPSKDAQAKEMLKKVLNCYPTLDQYSIISLHP